MNNKNSAASLTLSLFKGRQKAKILWYLQERPLRFSELKKLLDPVSKKVFTNQLKELEKDGLIVRTVYPEVPLRVEYSLSYLGRSVQPLFNEIALWQNYYRENYSHYIKDDRLLIDDFSGNLILEIIGDKWTPHLLRVLHLKKKRFGEIKKELSPISQKVLTEHLRNMENYGLVKRFIYDEKPPKVEYTLTELGISLQPIFNIMSEWGKVYEQERNKKEKEKCLD